MGVLKEYVTWLQTDEKNVVGDKIFKEYYIFYMSRKTHVKHYEGFCMVNRSLKVLKIIICYNFWSVWPTGDCLTVLEMGENFQHSEILT